MADIKQAAKWMQERKSVTRAEYLQQREGDNFLSFHSDEEHVGMVLYKDGKHVGMYIDDLLADDWEVDPADRREEK